MVDLRPTVHELLAFGIKQARACLFPGLFLALTVLAVNMLGLGLGPTLIAVLNDHVFRDPNMIHLSILLVCVAMAAISLLFILIAYRPYVALVNALQQSQAEEGRQAFARGGH